MKCKNANDCIARKTDRLQLMSSSPISFKLTKHHRQNQPEAERWMQLLQERLLRLTGLASSAPPILGLPLSLPCPSLLSPLLPFPLPPLLMRIPSQSQTLREDSDIELYYFNMICKKTYSEVPTPHTDKTYNFQNLTGRFWSWQEDS